MKISYNWLSNYLKTSLSPESIGELLTDIGLELEGLETVESIKGGLRDIVIGQVLTCEKHPNADKLSVTTVDAGQGTPLHIVCGAPNVAAGQKVFVALVGAKVYGKDGLSFEINKGNIRGEVSEGMLCAEDELGLGNSHEGLLILPDETKVGTLAAEYFNVTTDYVFEIGLTPNRSDATNHIGVARDLYAALKFRSIDNTASFCTPDVVEDVSIADNKSLHIEVENTAACLRYSGIMIESITVGESPDWLKTRLLAINQRPINNVVDITNYILHETGQPLHAFDADKIAENTIKVKNLPDGTAFTTLDGIERKLSANDLMICDGDSAPMCMAGVFGGQHSGVSDATKRIFLESACFNASSIRKTSTAHNLRTDAARCFEKGSDPDATVFALKRAIYLFRKYTDAVILGPITDIFPTPIERRKVKVRFHRINSLIGTEISQQNIRTILQLLDMQVVAEDKESLTITIPNNKTDVWREVDVIEEIFRIYGLNEIPTDSRLSFSYNSRQYPDPTTVKSDIAKLLSGIGLHEIMSVSLTQSSYFEKGFNIPREKLVFINNTGNVHLDIMRPTLLVSGIEALSYNINRQQHNQQNNYRFFEFGRKYIKEDDQILEKDQLAIFMVGQRWPENWNIADKSKLGFGDIKAVVEYILNKTGISGYQETVLTDEHLTAGLMLHRGPQVLARIGKLKATVCKTFDIKQEIWAAVIEWHEILKLTGKQAVHATELNKFPSVRRDLALIIEKNIKFSDIAKIANKAGKPLLKELMLFDVYENAKQIGETKKSYAVSFIFEQTNGTLKDEEVEQLMQKIRKSCEEQLGAFIRH